MRRKISLILICVACMTFGGCFIEQAPLNDKELGIVAQYAADTLLRHNKNYSDILLTPAQLTPTPTKVPIQDDRPTSAPTNTPIPTAAPSGNPAQPSVSPSATPLPTETPAPTELPDNTEETFEKMAKVIGTEGCTITLEDLGDPVAEGSFKVGDGVLLLSARSDGKLYLVTKFRITNNSDSPKSLNCYAKDLTCVLSVNINTNMYPCDTLTLEDLRFIGIGDKPEVLEAGKSYETVLIFAVKKDTKITRAALTLTNKDKESVVIKIK